MGTPADLARQPGQSGFEANDDLDDGRDNDGNMSWKSPEQEGDKDAAQEHMAQYGAKIRQEKKGAGGIGILPRRERILNVRYMTNTIKDANKSQNSLLESKVRSLFIQHLREQDNQ